MAFFLHPKTERPTGPCLVVYKDGSLAQGYVPTFDFRIQYALENHNVTCYSLEPQPSAAELKVGRLSCEQHHLTVLCDQYC